jgi:hypothetical protein
VQLTASITPATAGGSVQFLDGATVLGTVPVVGGAAVLSVSTLAAGTHVITAAYSGDAGDTASTSSAVTVTVSKLSSTVAVGASLNPSVSGQSVSFTATVTPSGATGTVQFLDGATVLGSAALSGGAAVFSTAALAPGSHNITASYSGDATYYGAASSLAQIVKAITAISVTSNQATAYAGQPVQFTAAVTPASASGTVQFQDGGVTLGSASLSGGIAVFSTSSLSVGTHSITALYSGDTLDTGSTSPVYTQRIVPPPPDAPTNLAASPGSATQISLTWGASRTPGVTYDVYGSTTAGFAPSAANRVVSGLTHTNDTVKGLTPGTTYYFVVTAINANGESAPSNQATATTKH